MSRQFAYTALCAQAYTAPSSVWSLKNFSFSCGNTYHLVVSAEREYIRTHSTEWISAKDQHCNISCAFARKPVVYAWAHTARIVANILSSIQR